MKTKVAVAVAIIVMVLAGCGSAPTTAEKLVGEWRGPAMLMGFDGQELTIYMAEDAPDESKIHAPYEVDGMWVIATVGDENLRILLDFDGTDSLTMRTYKEVGSELEPVSTMDYERIK